MYMKQKVAEQIAFEGNMFGKENGIKTVPTSLLNTLDCVVLSCFISHLLLLCRWVFVHVRTIWNPSTFSRV